MNNIKMKFYHRFFNMSDMNNIPHHYLYAATELDKYGFDVQYHIDSSFGNRIFRIARNCIKIMMSAKNHHVLYASTPNGLEALIIMRSLGIYRKPIVTWQHTALKTSNNPFVKFILKFYYRGFDQMFMFSPMHIESSANSGIIRKDKMQLGKWGPDARFYQRVIERNANADQTKERFFSSNGRENRDFPTLITAFSRVKDSHLKIYTSKQHGNMKNADILSKFADVDNVAINILNGKSENNFFLASEILNSYCMVICCTPHPYTNGVTSLLEAMALGKAVITSDNPYFPIDVEKENIGIKVPYGDVDGWVKAIEFMLNNKELVEEMGRNAKRLMEREYNLKLFSDRVASRIIELTR
jgi:glycosyltransferase involved in cell wall biosynthesis